MYAFMSKNSSSNKINKIIHTKKTLLEVQVKFLASAEQQKSSYAFRNKRQFLHFFLLLINYHFQVRFSDE